MVFISGRCLSQRQGFWSRAFGDSSLEGSDTNDTEDFDFFFFPGFIPVCSLGVAQVGRMNFGKDVSTLKYFTICGLQEGYEPFAVNTNRDITMWLSKRLPQFLQVPSNHEHIEVCYSFKFRPLPKIRGGIPTWAVIVT